MSSGSPCSICCSSCASKPVVSRSLENAAEPQAFAVQNLLPAGTLSLPISRTELGNTCDHSHSAEGWHTFLGKFLLPYLTDQENETLCRHLDFLVDHRFLVIHCKIGDSGIALILRLYLVPYDLPGVQGRLRVRNEASELKPARLCLRNVMPRIVQDKSLWDSHDLDASSSSPRYFLNSDAVIVLPFCFCPENSLATQIRIIVPWQRSIVIFLLQWWIGVLNRQNLLACMT